MARAWPPPSPRWPPRRSESRRPPPGGRAGDRFRRQARAQRLARLASGAKPILTPWQNPPRRRRKDRPDPVWASTSPRGPHRRGRERAARGREALAAERTTGGDDLSPRGDGMEVLPPHQGAPPGCEVWSSPRWQGGPPPCAPSRAARPSTSSSRCAGGARHAVERALTRGSCCARTSPCAATCRCWRWGRASATRWTARSSPPSPRAPSRRHLGQRGAPLRARGEAACGSRPARTVREQAASWPWC